MEVVGKPRAQLEVALANRPVTPGRGDLGDAATIEGGLDRQLECQLEPGLALDRGSVEEPARVELELLVGSWVATPPNQWRVSPAVRLIRRLGNGPPTWWPPFM